jgi:acetyl esterase/lipase
MNARHLGIDAKRVIAGGGSSGGTIAVFAAYNKSFEPDDEDGCISSKPDALVFINPALGFSDDRSRLTPEQRQGRERPARRLRRPLESGRRRAPCDPFLWNRGPVRDKARDFARQFAAVGARADFYTAAGQEHAFFNRFPDSPWHALVGVARLSQWRP